MRGRGALTSLGRLLMLTVIGIGQALNSGDVRANTDRGTLSPGLPQQEEERDSPVGRWVGHMDLGTGNRSVELTVASDGPAYRGEVVVWGQEQAFNVTDVTVDEDDSLRLRLSGAGEERTFEGHWAGDAISGSLSSSQEIVDLYRVAELDDHDYRPFIGAYRSTQGDDWFVGTTDLAGRYYLAEGDRQMRLFPIGPNTFYATTGERVRFDQGPTGAVTGLIRLGSKGQRESGTRVAPYATVPFRVGSEDIILTGELLVPEGSGPFPAVVFTHGSGPETRERRRLLADRFARRGIAAAIYDKRGTGESKGDWYAADFDALVGDALAVLRFVATQPRTIPDAVGLWGLSQGGWVVPLAASRATEVAFAITVSASGFSPNAQELYRWHNVLSDLGYQGPTLDAALKGVRLQQDLNAANIPIVDDLFLGLNFDYDPVPALEQISQPILAIWGADDRVVPPHNSAVVFRKALRVQPHPDATLRIFEGAGHSLAHAPTPDGWIAMPADYVDTMTDWVLTRTLPQPDLRHAARMSQSISLDDLSEEVIPTPAMPWVGRAMPQLIAMLLMATIWLVAALGWPIKRLVASLRHRPTPQRAAWLLHLSHSAVGAMGLVLVVGFFGTLGRFLMSDDGALLVYATDLWVRLLSWLVPLGALITGILTWRAGRRGRMSHRADPMGALLVGTGLLLGWFLRYWELLRL